MNRVSAFRGAARGPGQPVLPRVSPAIGLVLAVVVVCATQRDGSALPPGFPTERPLPAQIVGESEGSPNPFAGATVTRGPYLQCATPTSIVIRWRTSIPTDARVRWGRTAGRLDARVSSVAVTTEHEIIVTGLDPGTRYWYSVGTGFGQLAGDPTCAFVTPPPVGSAQPVRAWIIGDSGEAGSIQGSVRDAFLAYTGSRGADLFLMLGDNAYGEGSDSEYQAGVFVPYALPLRQWTLWPTRGNHDGVYSGANNDYYDFFSLPAHAEAGGVPSGTEAYYSYDYANVHFVCLDSEGSDKSPGGAMVTWLRADLSATSQQWVIVYWHHPPYSKGSHDSDTESDLIAMRQNVVPILDVLGADLVLCGHSHSYERSFLLRWHYGLSTTLTGSMKVDSSDGRRNGNGPYVKPVPPRTPSAGIVYTVAGSSSKTGGGSLNHPVMVSSQDVPGSLVLDVNGSVLDVRFLNSAGVVADSFTVVKAGVASVPADPARGFSIVGISPRPSHGPVELSYRLPYPGRVKVAIYDAEGRRIAKVADGDEPAGERRVRWDARDAAGTQIVAGVYFAVVELAGERRVARVVLTR